MTFRAIPSPQGDQTAFNKAVKENLEVLFGLRGQGGALTSVGFDDLPVGTPTWNDQGIVALRQSEIRTPSSSPMAGFEHGNSTIYTHGTASGQVYLCSNAYHDGTNWRYKTDGLASMLWTNASGMYAAHAVSGTKDAVITWVYDLTALADTVTVSGNDPALVLTDTAGTPASSFSIRSADGQLKFRDVSNSSDRVTIDAAGRILKPYQPMWSGQQTTSSGTSWVANTWTAMTALGWTTLVNRGNCFNSSNARFTAPVAGAYRAQWNNLVLPSATGQYWQLAITKNGSIVAYTLCPTQLAAYAFESVNVVVDMAVNDYISFMYFCTTTNGTLWGGAYSHAAVEFIG